MLLTCPTCASGLEVPDGTTALVRCPACKTVFAPADGLAPSEPVGDEDEAPRRARRPRRDRDDEDDDRPRRGRGRRRDDDGDDGDDERPKNRDFDPPDPDEDRKRRKRRRAFDDEGLSADERAAARAAFARAAWGARLIWVSLTLFMISMVCVIGFWFQEAVPKLDPNPGYVVGAGVVGAFGWVLGAVGVGLCLSGPRSAGHWGYGIAAAAATGLHLLFLLVLAAKGQEVCPGKSLDPEGPVANWGLVPTRLDAVTFYLTLLVYPDQEVLPKGKVTLSIVVGILEMIRTTLILVFLSCLARAAGDEDLSHKCTRAAGFTSWGPGFMAGGMLAFAVGITESHATGTQWASVLFATVVMGTYAVLNGCVFPGFMAAREVDDACEEPFQSQIPQL